MRLFCVLGLAGLTAFAALGVTPEPAAACDRVYYRGGSYVTAAPMTYYQPYAPSYFAPAYPAPRVYPAQPVYAPPSYGYPGYQPQPATATPPAKPTTSAVVGLYDNRFEPATLTVAPGTTVRWTNYGRHRHTVTSSAGRWDSGDLDPGKVYSATFNQPGTYEYHCKHHKEMRGIVIVK
jgi:plastocyanin